MIQFLSPDIESSGTFSPEESAHCVRVLRKRVGDVIAVTDGKGNRFDCEITDADPRCLKIRIVNKECVEKEYPYRIILAVAPTKNSDRMEWLVEKAVEIGVDEIVLLQCDRSERKKMGTSRLNRIAVSAMNQSLKTRMPEIGEMSKLTEFLKRSDMPDEKYFGYCSPSVPRCDFNDKYARKSDVVILIGPEGDFSDDEVGKLMDSGFQPVTFGNFRLRTETAALYGIQAVHILNSLK